MVLDPWNSKVVAGNFGYRTRSGEFVQIQPCQGKSNVIKAGRWRLGERKLKPLKAIFLCMDSDVIADGESVAATRAMDQSVEGLVRAIDAGFTRLSDAVYAIDENSCRVCTIPWHIYVEDRNVGIPAQQTLERLACISIARAYPDRPLPVQNWLDSIPQVGAEDPKRFAWSYMSGWYAGKGCEAFYTMLWNDERISGELESLLRAAGYWQTLEEIVG